MKKIKINPEWMGHIEKGADYNTTTIFWIIFTILSIIAIIKWYNYLN